MNFSTSCATCLGTGLRRQCDGWSVWEEKCGICKGAGRYQITAQGIEAGIDETLQAAQPEGQEPGGEAMRPNSTSQDR